MLIWCKYIFNLYLRKWNYCVFNPLPWIQNGFISVIRVLIAVRVIIAVTTKWFVVLEPVLSMLRRLVALLLTPFPFSKLQAPSVEAMWLCTPWELPPVAMVAPLCAASLVGFSGDTKGVTPVPMALWPSWSHRALLHPLEHLHYAQGLRCWSSTSFCDLVTTNLTFVLCRSSCTFLAWPYANQEQESAYSLLLQLVLLNKPRL